MRRNRQEHPPRRDRSCPTLTACRNRRRRLPLLLAVTIVFLVGCGTDETSNREPSQSVQTEALASDRFALSIPEEWDGRVYRRPDPVSPGPVAQAANFKLPANDDDVASEASEVIPEDGVVLVIMEYEEIPSDGKGDFFLAREQPLGVSRDDIVPTFEGVVDDHAFISYPFSLDGRSFDVRIEFGVREPSEELIQQVSDVLASFELRTR
jgi:hypothetical protein